MTVSNVFIDGSKGASTFTEAARHIEARLCTGEPLSLQDDGVKILDWSNVMQGEFDVSESRVIHIKPVYYPSVIARRSYFYLQQLVSSNFPSRHYTRRSGVDSYLIALTFFGQGRLEYENTAYTLQPGDGFIIDCRKPHYYHAASHLGWGYHIIHFNGFAMADYFSQIEHAHGIKFTISRESVLYAQLEQLYKTPLAPSRYTLNTSQEILTSCILTNILTEIMQTMPIGDAGECPDKILRIRDYLEEHCAEHISLNDLASRFAMSKYHLCHEFKKHIGEAPKEYLTNARIYKAKTMLHFTNRLVADIAQEVGYAGNTHFFTLFKKHEGMSPAEYRKR
ncbi:MAG: AraC family transcriptional regulator [Treponema sp.]|jgi:AraC-like DNA-binding protein|nr:AraC family transcriptional regulator [Treponema sp.]